MEPNNSGTMELEALIHQRLALLAPLQLVLQDQSAAHRGHPGAANGARHYSLYIVSAQFSGHAQVVRHRMIYQQLADLIPATIHALKIKALAPDEEVEM